MSEELPDEPVLSAAEAAQVASLEAVRASLVADAVSWGARMGELSALAALRPQGVYWTSNEPSTVSTS